MPSYVITGANRGVGFALLKQLSADPGNVVFAIVRSVKNAQDKVAAELPGRKNIHFVHGDLADPASIRAAADAVSSVTGGSLDVLIGNAGLVVHDFIAIDSPKQDWALFDEASLKLYKVNTLGNIHLMSSFAPLLRKGNIKKAVVLSTGMAAVDFTVKASSAIQAPYAMSKTALNLAVAKFHTQYAKEGILFMALSPGLVDTGPVSEVMGDAEDIELGMQEMMTTMGAYAAKEAPDFKGPITPEESASRVMDIIEKATIEKNGGIMVSHHGNQKWL